MSFVTSLKYIKISTYATYKKKYMVNKIIKNIPEFFSNNFI